MNTDGRRKFPVIFVILFLILGLAACVVLVVLRSPLAQRLEVAVATDTSEPTAVANQPGATRTPPAPAKPRPTATPAGVCGMTGQMTILFSGTGVAAGMNSADAVRVLKVDFNQETVTVLAFQRDLYLQMNVMKASNMPEGRLGPAFHYKKQITAGTEREKSISATTVVAQVLYDNFGVTPDHYITVNIEPWSDMIDTIGGVEITLPQPVQLGNGISLPAGKQRLDGRLAKEYVRSLGSAGEQERIARQNLFVQALHDQVLSGATLPKIPELLRGFNGSIVTDLSPQQLLALGCMSEKVKNGGVTFVELDGTMVSTAADGALIPDVQKVRTLVEKTLGR